MKLHVLAYNGHHQVSIPIKGNLYIWVGGADVEISMHQFPVALLSGANSYVQAMKVFFRHNNTIKNHTEHYQHVAHSTQMLYSSTNITITNSVTVILKYGTQHIFYVQMW